jgi:hypothetical protein
MTDSPPRPPVSRVIAFLLGRQTEAEDFPEYADIEAEPWITDSAEDDLRAEYALDVTKRSADWVDASVTSIRQGAASVTSFAVPLIPVAIAVLGFALAQWPNVFAIISSTLFILTIVLLLAAAVRGYLGSGATLAGGVNPRRLAQDASSLGALRAKEADAWLMSMDLGFRTISRRSGDLFAARRAIAWAFVVATLATGFFVIAQAQAGDEESSRVTLTIDKNIEVDIGQWQITVVPKATTP